MPSINALSNHPINIPTEFPGILKAYTKAAIRTQPKDLLLWSAAYFRCLARGETPPAKDRLEYPVPTTMSGLTPGLLRVLHKQLGAERKVSTQVLAEKWKGICLEQVDLDHILLDGGWKRGEVDWIKFLGMAAFTISSGLESAMQVVCEVLSEPVDGSANIATDQFAAVFKFLAARSPEMTEEKKTAILDHVEKVGAKQGGKVNIHNFRVPGSPTLE